MVEETWGLGCFYALFCKKKGFLDDVMMTCYEKSEVGLIRWRECFFSHLDSMLSQAFGGWGECI